MAVAPQQSITTLFQGFNRLSAGQKIGAMAGLAAIIALAVGLYLWSQVPDYKVLFSNLSDRDGGSIVNALQQMNVPYKVADGGTAILVPSDKVYDVRLQLASQGLPKGGAVGFELMENQKLGTSQFQEQVNYQRGLEGELSRSIQSLSAVQHARVHLALPRPSVFVRERQLPSASVLVSLYPGRVLEPGQVSGIMHLISSSVPEMPLKNVTVVDQAGRVLGPATDSVAQAGLNPGQLDYLHRVEQSYVKRIEDILAPIVGADNVRAQVAANLDFAQTEQTAELYKPNTNPEQATIRSQQTRESSGVIPPAQGVPGALSNQPPGAASAPLTAPAGAATAPAATGSSQKESTVNYEVDKTIRHVRQPVGTVERLSVAVVVNFAAEAGTGGKVELKPRSPEQMAQITNLVREAVGFSQQRGDTLNVVSAPFKTDIRPGTEPLPIWKEPEAIALAKEIAKNLLVVAIVLYLVFGIFRPIVRDLMRERVVAETPAGQEVAFEGGEIGIPGGGAPTPAEQAARTAGYEENLKAAKELAKADPRIVANVVKEWVEGA